MKGFLLSLVLLLAAVGCGQNYPKANRQLINRTDQGVVEDEFIVASQIHRDKGSDVFSSRFERDLIASGALPAGYRTIPVMAIDDEGKDSANIRTRSGLGRPNNNCGLTAGLTITQRVEDCSGLNVDTASWIGTENGASGETTWRLVARSGELEIWLDTRSGHLWSDVVSTTNWCNASGNKEAGTSVNCSTLASNVSCTNAVLLGIAGINWRLPTRNEFLQADIDGLRFVMKPSTTGFWTSTLDSQSTNRSQAWVYLQTQGTLEKASMTEDRSVRCIGAAPL